MRSDKWMLAVDAAEHYSVDVQSIYMKKNKHWFSHRELKPYKVKKVFINVGFLERIVDRRRQLLKEATDAYYEFSEFYTDYKLAMLLGDKKHTIHSWYSFLTFALFKPQWDKATILDTRIPGMLVLFVRKTRRLRNDLHKRYKEQEAS